MALALNNLKRVDMPLNKEINQTIIMFRQIFLEETFLLLFVIWRQLMTAIKFNIKVFDKLNYHDQKIQ